MDEELGKVARKQWGVFSRAQAIEHGATKWTIGRRVAQRKWTEVAPGVYRFPGGNESWHQKVSAATLALSPHGMASHRTAAFLWELDGRVKDAPAMIEVIAPMKVGRHVALAKVHHTRVIPEAQVRQRIATTPLARTLVDLADVLDAEYLFIAFDSARRKFKNVIPELEVELRDNCAGRRHSELVADLVRRWKTQRSTDSALEARAAFAMDKFGLPRPVPQHVVYGSSGDFIARVDFAWIDQRVVLLCDSHEWHLAPAAFEKDALQRRQLEADGWRVIQVTWKMLKKRDWLVDLSKVLSKRSHLAL